MFDLAIDSKLRGCDIVEIKIGELVSGGLIRSRATVIQTLRPLPPFRREAPFLRSGRPQARRAGRSRLAING
jgi:hypothetical protein